MKYKFGDVCRTTESRAEQIRRSFVAGSTIQAHTAKCIEAQIWTESELLARATSACRNEVRDALGVLIDGLPWAGPTQPEAEAEIGPKEKPAWKQIELWSKDDFVFNFSAYAKRGGQNIAVANSIASACLKRFGEAPKLLLIVEEEDEPDE